MQKETDLARLLNRTTRRALRYLEGIEERSVAPAADAVHALQAFDEALPEDGLSAEEVLDKLDELGSPATTTTTGGRYFGFVIGSVLPAALGADWLCSAWDQNAGMSVVSPIAARLEEVAARWTLDALRLPAGAAVGFVTGATAANTSGLAAARHALLERSGFDVERDGLFGAPPLRIVAGDEVHVSVLKAIGLLGMGHARVERVPTDDQGALLASELPDLDDQTIVCIQAGNVNTGSFDPATEVVAAARAAGAWVHVDGAFGLWARASSRFDALTAGLEGADSWSTDAHKWLNVPYDSGLVICRDPSVLRKALGFQAAYLIDSGNREPAQLTPELSRRARGIPVWAALSSLGRAGLRDLVERCCTHARTFAERLVEAGHTIPHEVVLNQVLVLVESEERLARVLTRVQDEGIAWFGGTTWHGKSAIRISVSSWRTSADDVERSAEALIRALALP